MGIDTIKIEDFLKKNLQEEWENLPDELKLLVKRTLKNYVQAQVNLIAAGIMKDSEGILKAKKNLRHVESSLSGIGAISSQRVKKALEYTYSDLLTNVFEILFSHADTFLEKP